MIKIAPSILASDFSKLGEEIKKVEGAGADLIHIDVMDGHFVPNISIGPVVVESIRKVTSLPFDVHLMIENADSIIDSFIDAGADIISVHVEAGYHLNRTIQKIKSRNVKASVVLNPATPLSSLEWIIEDVDMILLMSVNPGFGGQKYIENVTEKIARLRELLDSKGLDTDIEVDGGVDETNIYTITKAGANVIVAGSAIFRSADPAEVIRKFRENSFKK
jgi:ribulose-phosphate 3-epimerase